MAAARPAHVTPFCRVSVFAECFILGTRQSLLLPSAICLPSVSLNTLGNLDVCRVPDGMHSANPQTLGNYTVSGSGSSTPDTFEITL